MLDERVPLQYHSSANMYLTLHIVTQVQDGI